MQWIVLIVFLALLFLGVGVDKLILGLVAGVAICFLIMLAIAKIPRKKPRAE